MTINSALLAGVTGLTANASALAAISENIANANTIGYKRVGVDFSSLVNTGSKSSYAAGGVATNTRSFTTQQGTLQASTSPTDLGIYGEGFFVTTPKTTGLTAQDASGADVTSKTYQRGVVTSVEQSNGTALLNVNGAKVAASAITTVS